MQILEGHISEAVHNSAATDTCSERNSELSNLATGGQRVHLPVVRPPPFPFVTAPIPKQNDLRSKDRSMKRLLHDPTAEGPKNRLRTFADAVMLQAHNQSRTLSQDPRLGYFQEVATFEQWRGTGGAIHIILTSHLWQ